MFNQMIVVSVTPFSGTDTADKNGNYPVMLQCIAGTMPNRNVLSGTVAKRMGIEEGKTYLMSVRESGYDKKFGTDYTFTKIKELHTGKDIVDASKELGDPDVFTVNRPEGFESSYERKGNAIEGIRTKRIKEGQYVPVQGRVYDHETANEIIQGSSVESDVNLEKDGKKEKLAS